MKYIIPFFFFFNSMLVFSQKNGTVFDLLHLEKTACPLNESTYKTDALVGTVGGYGDRANTNPKKKIHDTVVTNALRNQINSFQKKVSDEYSLNNQSVQTGKIIFKNKNYLYKENGLYGIKDVSEKIIVAPIFKHIGEVDSTGFSAYINEYCTYYNSSGVKVVGGNYFSIKKIKTDAFLIQSASGYGVVNLKGDVIIKPIYDNIKVVKSFETLYFRVYTNRSKSYLINETGKDTVWVNLSYEEPQTFCPGIWIESGVLYNIKTKRQLVCHKDLSVEGLNPTLKTVAIRKSEYSNYSTKITYYLSDVEGNLITKNAFSKLYYIRNCNVYGAGVRMKLDEYSKEMVDKFALLDMDGKWLFGPTYSRIEVVADSFIVASNYDGTHGVIKKNGDVVIPFQYTDISESPIKNLLFCTNSERKTSLIDGRTGEIIQEHTIFSSLSKVNCVGTTVYIANNGGKEFLVDSTFKRISPDYGRIFFGYIKKGIFEGMSFYNKPDGTYGGNTVSYFDYTGKAMPFVINNETYTQVKAANFISNDLKHVYIDDVKKTGYFIYKDNYLTCAPYHWQSIENANNKETYTVMAYGGKHGLINKKGEFLIPPVFEYISSFNSTTKRAIYHYGEDRKIKGYINEDGSFLFGTDYMETIDLGMDLFAVKKNNLWGVVTLDNKIVVPIDFTSVKLTGGLIVAVDDTGSKEIFNILGKQIQ